MATTSSTTSEPRPCHLPSTCSLHTCSTDSDTLSRGHFFISDPEELAKYNHKIKLGIHSTPSCFLLSFFFHRQSAVDWAQHGISGRGVLLDLVRFFTEGGTKPLPYDPWSTHGFSVKDLEDCAAKQGVEFRRGDILLIRGGFGQKWWATTRAERESLSEKPEAL